MTDYNNLINYVEEQISILSQSDRPSKNIANMIIGMASRLTVGERKAIKKHYSAISSENEHYLLVSQMII